MISNRLYHKKAYIEVDMNKTQFDQSTSGLSATSEFDSITFFAVVSSRHHHFHHEHSAQ